MLQNLSLNSLVKAKNTMEKKGKSGLSGWEGSEKQKQRDLTSVCFIGNLKKLVSQKNTNNTLKGKVQI